MSIGNLDEKSTVVADFLNNYVDDGILINSENKLKMELRSAQKHKSS